MGDDSYHHGAFMLAHRFAFYQGFRGRDAHQPHLRPPAVNMLVMGPWNHGGFARGDGDRLGNVNFGSKTAAYYRERIELPFFLYYLKGRGDGKFPQAYIFQTGMNTWRKFDSWPPPTA